MAVLDTHWHDNPKILGLGLEGMGLHAWGISYCDDNLTDGFIPEAALPQALPGCKQALRAVLKAGRWVTVAGGYEVHDYLAHNRSRAKVQAIREHNRARKDAGKRNGRPA